MMTRLETDEDARWNVYGVDWPEGGYDFTEFIESLNN